MALCIFSISSLFDIQDNFPRHSFSNFLHSNTMIPSARPRRLQGRFIFFSAVASLFLLYLFLWRTADPRIVDPRLSSAVAHAKQTIGNEHSSHSLFHVSDEYLDDYETLTNSQDKNTELKPTPIVHPFSLSLPPASSSVSTPSSNAVQSQDAIPTEPAQTPVAKVSPVNTSQNPRIPGKPNNLTISGFVFYGRRDRVESMHCYLEVCCVDFHQASRLLTLCRGILSHTAVGWIM